MSQSQMQEITCPKCGKKQFFRVWDSINTMEDPPLKKAVRNDEAFSFHCLDCGAFAVLHYNFIYHEPAEKLFIVCNADGSDYTAMKETLTAEDNAFKSYTKRIVLSHNAFKEKLLIFDAGFNDKIVEVMKSGIYANVEAHYKDKGIDEIFFATNEEGEHGFLLLRHGEMLAAVEFDKALYDVLLEKALETIDALSPTDVIIDTEWARAMVERL